MPVFDAPSGGRSWRYPQGLPAGLAPAVRRHAVRPGPGGSGRRFRLIVAGVAFFVFCGSMVWLITWLLRPPPVRVVLLTAGYEQNLAVPHNVYGRRWAEALSEWTGTGPVSGFLRVDGGGPQEFRSQGKWDAGLRGARERTIVLAIAAHGGADEAGPYLIPTDATPGAGRGNRLRLETILSRLAELPARTKKVLILDATQVAANPLFGILENDFAGGLDRLSGKIAEIPNLVVLSSSSPGERSFSIDSLGRTAFGHYLLEGLSGESDENRDRRINGLELFHYTSERVDRWAVKSRGVRQLPRLYPPGEEGEKRAQAVTLAILPAVARPRPDDAPKAFTPPPALRSAWDRHHELEASTPHPAAYVPHAWRVYEASLLRYEQLVYAGDDKAAAVLAARLPALERDLMAHRELGLGSTWTSLAMPSLAGSLPTVTEPARRKFDDLWNAPAGEIPKRIEDWRKTAPVSLLYSLLFERVVADPAHLAKAATLARAVGPASQWPNEIHFLVALASHLPQETARTNGETVRQALRVRHLGEQVAVGFSPDRAGYAEQIHPILASRLAELDAARERREDLLFATTGSPADGPPSFAEIEKGYRQLLAVAQQLRAAADSRDRLFASLPALAKWAAEHPGPYADRLGTLWERLRELDGTAQRFAAGDPDDAKRIAELASSLIAERDGIAKAAVEDARHVLPLPPQGMTPVAARAIIDRSLSTPVLPAETRQQLLALSHRLDREELGSTQPPPGAPSREGERVEPSRYGLLVLSSLGQATYDALRADRQADYLATFDKLKQAPADPDRVRVLTGVGSNIAARLTRLPLEIRSRLDRGAVVKLDQLRTGLREADRLSRVTPAGLTIPQGEPATAYRKLLTQALLIGLTRRTAAEGWAGEGDEPSFRVAGKALLKDAADLGQSQAVREELDSASRQLNRRLDLTLSTPDRMEVTDDTPFSVSVVAEGPADKAKLPFNPGYLVVWAEPATGVDFAEAKPPGRVAKDVEGRHRYDVTLKSPVLALSTSPSAASVVQTQVAVKGFFRGRVYTATAPVDLWPRPEIALRHRPPPPGVGVAVRADYDFVRRFGVGDGAVAFVLDCSGSMAPPPGQPAESSRLKQGINAIRKLLTDLPRKTQVSVWAFGQAGDGGKRVDAAEKTVLRVVETFHWDPDNPGQPTILVERLGQLEPYNQSPMFRALLEARADVLPASGYKAVVLITDGGDNRFAADKELNPEGKPPLAVLRNRLREGGVAVHVVGFPPRSQEESNAQSDLKPFVSSLPVPGKFVLINELEDLATLLRSGFRPRLRCKVWNPSNGPGRDAFLDVVPGGTADGWLRDAIGPGRHQISAVGTSATAPFVVRDGDRLLLTLGTTPHGPGFRRTPYAGDFPWKPFAESDQGDWRLSVLENRLEKSAGVRMLATLERTADEVAEITRPAEAWFELGTDLETSTPLAVDVSTTWGYPAPAWNVTVPHWPNAAATGTPARPVLTAWFSDSPQRPGDAVFSLEELEKTCPRIVRLGRDEVVLESVTRERREWATGEPARSQAAVVVRLRFPPGKPVTARLDGAAAGGYDHRLYTRAGRYTGVFWPAEADLRGASVRLVSLDEFKAAARRIEIRGLKPPDPNDDRPAPVDAPPLAAKGR